MYSHQSFALVLLFFLPPSKGYSLQTVLSSPRSPFHCQIPKIHQVSVVFTPWHLLFIFFRSELTLRIEYPNSAEFQAPSISVLSMFCRCVVAVHRGWGPEYPPDVDKCHPSGLQSELRQLWVPLVPGGCRCSHPHGACRYCPSITLASMLPAPKGAMALQTSSFLPMAGSAG